MNSLLQKRRSMHQSDDIYHWGYQRHDHTSSKSSQLFHIESRQGTFQGSESARKGRNWQWSWRKARNFQLGRSYRYTLFTQYLHNIYTMHTLRTFATHS